MTLSILLYIIFTAALLVSIAFNYYQKRKLNKMLRLVALKNQNVMLAIRAGNIAVWGYDVKRGHLYNIEGDVFAEKGASIAEAMAGVHPDDSDEFARILQDVVRGEIPKETICIRFKNIYTGEWEYVEKEFAVIKSRSGEVKTVIGTHKDVTKKVLEAGKTDDLLKKYQRLYNENQTILNSLPTGVSMYDSEGKLFYLNRTMCTMMGVKDVGALIASEFRLYNNPYVDNEIKTRIKQGESSDFYYQVDCKTLPGAYFYQTNKTLNVSCFFDVVKNESGEVDGYVFIHRDITQQQMCEQEMKDMSETLGHVIGASGFSVWEYLIEEHKFYSSRGDICVENGTSYEDTIAIHTPESAELCNTIFDKLINGVTEVEHAMFEIVDQENGKVKFYKCELVARKGTDGNIVKIYGVQKEVTDEQNHQLELEESKLKTKLAIETSDMVQWEYDVEKRIFHTVNEKGGSDVLTVDDYCQVTHPDDLPKVIEVVGLMDSGRNETFEFNVRFKFPSDSEWQYININGTPLKLDKHGAVVKFTGFQRNNTRWHNLTEELKEKDATNKLILNNMRSGLVYLSPDRKVIWENASGKFAWNETAGHRPFEVGKYCRETHMSIDRFCDTCMMEDVWARKDSLTLQQTLDNGNVLEIIGNPVVDDCGNLTGTILRIEDITERKRLYEELEVSRNNALSSNQLLREIVNRIPGALFIKDPNDDYRYIVANQLFCEIWQKSEDEIVGKTDFDFINLELAVAHRQVDEAVIDKQEPLIFEGVTDYDGEHRYWKTVKSSFTTGNDHQLLMAMSVDITEIRKTNIELQKAKNKAEESDKLKSAFLANMSHEIRTPLNAIVGFSELMKSSDDENEKEEYMRIISANNELLLRLINDILDLSKLESGIVQLHDSQFDLAQYFDELSTTMQHRITNPNVEFIAVNPYQSCIIETDKTRLTQIWHNFMTNAVKYTVSGHIKMGYEYVNNGIKIYVEDTGIGIPEAKKKKLFHRFEKLDSFAQGTGLGLSICKAIAELNGGEVGFESTEGEGSLFWSWKPIEAEITYKMGSENLYASVEETETENLDIEHYMKGRSYSVLVAEDNDSNYLLINHMLKNNFQLSRVVNGLDAVEFVKNNRVDLVLMDMKMPVMNGLEATRNIRTFDSDLPIIALTANAFDSDRSEAMDAGCNDFITKPMRKEELIRAMFRICKKNKKIS